MRSLALVALLAASCVHVPPPPPPPPPPPVTVVTPDPDYQHSLSPYGEWLYVPGYGRVWRPYTEIVGVDFAPYYSGGYWVFTDAGWMFEASWPWAPVVFHYGHWVYADRYGWVWISGTEWAPAWVEWRYGAGYVGWMPMPPPGFGPHVMVSWIFVDVHHFQRHDFHRYRVVDHRRWNELHRATAAVEVVRGRPYGPSEQRIEHDTGVAVRRYPAPRQGWGGSGSEGTPPGTENRRDRGDREDQRGTPPGVRDGDRDQRGTPPGVRGGDRDQRGTPPGGVEHGDGDERGTPSGAQVGDDDQRGPGVVPPRDSDTGGGAPSPAAHPRATPNARTPSSRSNDSGHDAATPSHRSGSGAAAGATTPSGSGHPATPPSSGKKTPKHSTRVAPAPLFEGGF